jgi:hypothetical protein
MLHLFRRAVAVAGAEAVLEFGLMGCAVGLAHGDGKFGGYPGRGKRQGEGGRCRRARARAGARVRKSKRGGRAGTLVPT